MTGTTPNTRDTIHITLEQLGYIGDQLGVARSMPMMYGIYRRARNAGERITVSWQTGSAVYDVLATSVAVIDVLSDALTAKGLTCEAAGKRMNVYGQEHIDAEVMRMLQS